MIDVVSLGNTKVDKKWMDNYTLFMLFCTTEQRFPKSAEKFIGINIGNWFMNQRKMYRQNSLDSSKIAMLDNISVMWRGSQEDLRKFRNEILAEELIQYAIEENQTPITQLVNITKSELNDLLSKKLRTCEMLLVSDDIDMSTKYRSISAIYRDNKLLNYLNLLNDLKEYKSYKELEHDIDINRLKINIDEAVGTLGEDERRIIVLYYGLESGESMTLREVGEYMKLSHERVRQILNKGIEALREEERFTGIICNRTKIYSEKLKEVG